MLLYIVDTSMRRNMCVAFVPLVPHHHVQVQLFLFSDHRSSSPKPSLFYLSSHIFPLFLLLNSSTSHILSWLFVALLQCTPPFYTWLIVAWHVLFCTTFSCGSIILSWLLCHAVYPSTFYMVDCCMWHDVLFCTTSSCGSINVTYIFATWCTCQSYPRRQIIHSVKIIITDEYHRQP